ncbi:MAG TPA: dTMP kinase [Bacteroidota bacterium]|nr:dTMP kinase [Bacteroidota bacterium]
MFVTFEGVDRSGKTTQATLLFETLRARGVKPVHLIREPGGTAISERIRELLLDRAHLELSELTELFLFSASRAQLVQQVIAPALRRGEIVICDRYYDSTTAYQGFGRGINLDAIRQINSLAVNQTVPDLTILVDVSAEVIERRRKATAGAADRMEISGRSFYERVRDGYLVLAREEPERFLVVNGMRPIDVIATEVHLAVESRLSRQSMDLKS